MQGGGQHDLTTGPIRRTLLMFTLPTLASNILQSLNGSINAIWVGRFLGEGALAATANANIIMFLMFSLVFGFGMASTVMIGQAMGAKDVDAARRVFGSAVGFCFVLAMAVGLGGWLLAPKLLDLLETPAEAYGLTLTYLRVVFVALPANMLSVMMMMGLRGVGDSVTPFRFMLLSVALDAGLNPLFILGWGPIPSMGIGGSAGATVVAGVVSFIGLVIYTYRKDLPLRLRGTELRYLLPSTAGLRMLFAKGLPMGLQMIVTSAAGLVMVGLVNREGLLTTAAYGASQQLWTYLQMPALAIGAGASAMAAQNIGAGRWDRVAQVTGNGLLFNALITGTLLALMLLFDRPALALFLGNGSPAIEAARHIQYLASWSYIMFGFTMVFFGTMRANGVVYAPLVVLFIAFYPVRLGFYEAFYPTLGPDALWLSFPVGSIVSLGLAAAIYTQGGWRKKKLMVPPHGEECREAVHSEAEPAGRMQPTG